MLYPIHTAIIEVIPTRVYVDDPRYKQYEGIVWDGFTIRNGYYNGYNANRDGGAGVRMFDGAQLKNCVVYDNFNLGGWAKKNKVTARAGGIYCDGDSSAVISCFVLDNILYCNNQDNGDGGGMYMIVGTCYNSLFAHNQAEQGGGVFIEDAYFYNNTIAYNTATFPGRGGGIMQWHGSVPKNNLYVFNTIIYGNNDKAIFSNGNIRPSRDLENCYVSSDSVMHPNMNVAIPVDSGNQIIPVGADTKLPEYNPFLRGDSARYYNDYRLKATMPAGSDYKGCVNAGLSEPNGVTLPAIDVAFAKRVQDCQVDIGAYEFNAAFGIKPDTTTHPGQAIFYVMFDSPGGNASADSPSNAACKQKLQQVLDAAGRYKYALMTETRYAKHPATPTAGYPDSTWSVEVWLEGDRTNSTTSDTYNDYYTPTRSTKNGLPGYQDNTLDYSFIVPHGVQLRGGYTADFTGRDPLTYRTVLSGNITSNTGAKGQTFHVVTFTNDLFGTDEDKLDEGGQLSVLTGAKDRAVLDGLFIEDGYANASDEDGRIGGAAVVTDYAHVRNCVIRNNNAAGEGGGLYLKPYALVSGCIIRDNSANTGGGIYVEPPARPNNDSLAYVYASTICANTATASAGGLWFNNTYVRVNSTVLWQNDANDNANVSGVFSRSSNETNYPFNFCAVESRRLEGQANIELSPTETEGVRWDHSDPFDAIQYYPIEMSSTLSRAGMTYRDWQLALDKFPTLDTVDIAGVSRLAWNGTGEPRGFAWTTDTLLTKNNDFIEIGARAINKNYAINVDERYVMHRLYVMHTDLINSEAARALQDNPGTSDPDNMYRQMGSCILNPFHRLGDAFDYIIAARKANPAKYRNVVFEVLIEQGTYYPYHNAYGEQDEVRNNTFLVPEAIYVIGGIDSRQPDHHYGQEGYYDPFTGEEYGDPNTDVVVAGYTINASSLDSIRLRDDRHRPMRDNNLNSVIEPWELERQTILSGNAVAGEDFTHVYHVITMTADSTKVGPQPFKYQSYEVTGSDAHGKPILRNTNPLPFNDPDQFYLETDYSILGRTTEFDGIQITGGYANHIDAPDTVAHHYTTKTYFQGGGMLVDGNWTQSFDNPEDTEVPVVTAPAKYNIPIVVENCVFSDNMAANGGAIYSNGGIYMYGCHFTQNYSQGPMTKLDQRYIPWSAGGCIAANATCAISNTLFDNNEARRGLYPLTAVSPKEQIADADARQGFGGVLSIGANASMKTANCHFMKNKAVAYPSIYNFWTNNRYSNPDSMQFAFNCIFWGNEVFEVDNIGQLEHVEPPTPHEIEQFNLEYKGSRSGVFHYDADIWNRYEKYYHEYDSLYHYWTSSEREVQERDTFKAETIAKLMQLRAVGDSLEGLYFCSYRPTYGPTGMKPTKEGYLLTKEEQRSFVDPRKKEVRLKPQREGSTYMVERLDSLFSYVKGNNNTLINRLNTATDGPNFKQPSFIAGIDGYMQNADWLQARMNITTDQGWGVLSQTVKRSVGYYITRWTGKTQYSTPEAALAAAKEAKSDTCTAWSVLPVSGVPVATFDADQSPTQAIYNWYAKRFGDYMSQTNPPLPLGEQQYMVYTRNNSDSLTSGAMNRISKNPRMGVTDVFIDIGVYEYQYVQLDMDGQEIDTMWVATKGKGPVQDGLTWESPTTDLQYAIDMLMSSRNNHDKYVCFLGDEEGYFTPNNVLDNRRTFLITSNSLEPLLPDSAEADTDYGVKSLTFLGGYSYDVKNAVRDPVSNPAVISMPDIGTRSQRNQLFVIEDIARQWEQANWQGQVTSRDKVVIPITFDGLTFINPYSIRAKGDGEGVLSNNGGAAIYYRWQRVYEDKGGTFTPIMSEVLYPDTIHLGEETINLPKLTIVNCIFMDNGDWSVSASERSSAVRIDHGGGSSLIANSLFHSNAGAPIYTHSEEIEGSDLNKVPNDITIVNSTFALNGDHLTLESDHNEVHNSLIWLDDLVNDTTTMLELGKGASVTRWGRATEGDMNRTGIPDRITYNAFWKCFRGGDAANHNDSLSTENNSVSYGPGFVNPFVSATTSDQRRNRSFRLNPSIKTVNRADTTLYRSRVFYRYPAAERPSVATDMDLAAKPRLSGPGMERGAYECLAMIQRVLYVRPDLAEASAGDGSSWEKAFGQGQLQNAIDAAAVYTYLNQAEENRESRKAYVFVHGSETATGSIAARDGVYVYGSIPRNFNDTAVANDQHNFTDAECRRFVNYARAYAPGVASSTGPTRISSVQIEGDEFRTGFLLDGFLISDNAQNTYTQPRIVLNNNLSAIRNCLITANKVADAPLADVQNGLLYNCLFYSDSAGTMVKVGANGLALNNTIVADDAAVVPIDTTDAAEGAAQNNIAITSQSSAVNCFAPYMTEKNPYELPAYLTSNASLAFQLYERSDSINAGTGMADLPAVFETYKADQTIDFSRDRDLLGNPRVIGSGVDMGALEAWYIGPKTAMEITSITNKVGHEATDTEKETAYTDHYGGNFYPHAGSVVYLMDSAVMTMQYENTDFVDLKDNGIVFAPGYMLLSSGASFYGNGHEVELAYLAAEKRFINQRYSMTALPFNYDIRNITVAAKPFPLVPDPVPFTSYVYNGAARSAKDYVFQSDNSDLWLRVDTFNRSANEGYLMDFGSLMTDTTLRFTAFTPAAGQYVYVEDSDDKEIYLTQYDHRTAGSGRELDFTRQEDMGWNMKGLPWLVTDYRTDTVLEGETYLRQMYIPHIVYRMDGANEYQVDGDRVLPFRTWDKGTTLSMGSAFLTQTATQKEKETVVFHLPYYGRNKRVPRPVLSVTPATPNVSHAPALASATSTPPSGNRGASAFVTLIPDSTADKTVRYSYGRDGVNWHADERSPQLYILDSKRTSAISLLGAAPTEVDIPLGLNIPDLTPTISEVTFALPRKEAFADYAYVWLIDYRLNKFTNLLEEAYMASVEPGEHTSRFAIRIGGFPKTGKDGSRQYMVYTYEGSLFVRGLVAGDRITVYSASGKLIHQAVSSGYEYTTPLYLQKGYVVKVNDKAHTVLNL